MPHRINKLLNEKGTVSSYNKQDVSTREYYYDRETTDKKQQDEFADNLKKLDKFNAKLIKELEKGEKADFKLSKEE